MGAGGEKAFFFKNGYWRVDQTPVVDITPMIKAALDGLSDLGNLEKKVRKLEVGLGWIRSDTCILV